MTIVNYNGVTLPYPMITDFSQESVYEESNTDYLYTKFSVALQFFISADFIRMYKVAAGNFLPTDQTPGLLMRLLRTQLMQQRKTLSIVANGVELIPKVDGLSGEVDSKNGPIPEFCNIIELTEGSFLMSYKVVAHYWESRQTPFTTSSGSVNAQKQAVLSNRWSETVEIDQCEYVRRTRTGKYIIRSDSKNSFTADELRGSLAVLGIPSGMVRKTAKYTVTPDGLGLDYTIIDEEVYMMPPEPAFEMSGKYTETSVTNGVMRHGEMYVKLRGNRKADRAKLIEVAVTMCARKLRSRGSKIPLDVGFSGYKIIHTVVTVDLTDNLVECRMKAMLQPGVAKAVNGDPTRKGEVWGLDFKALAGETPGIRSPFDPPAYTVRGNLPILLQAAAYNDPDLASELKKQVNLYGTNPDATGGRAAVNQMSDGQLPGKAGKDGE